MLNFSSNTLIENIGALELDAVTYSLDDVGLEASVGPATPTGGAWTQVCCRRVDDGVLENAAVTITVGPTIAPCTVMTCPRRIDDGALEASATMGPGQTIITYCGCGHIDDGALETSAYAHPPITVFPCKLRIDDGALEAMVVSAGPNLGAPTGRGWTGACCGRIDDDVLEMVASGPAPTSVHAGCYHIDDGAFEAAAAIAVAPSYNMGCSSTQGQMCRRIDDDALEATAVMTASPSFDTVCGSTIGPRCFHRIDDGALEASAGPGQKPMTIPFNRCRRIDGNAN